MSHTHSKKIEINEDFVNSDFTWLFKSSDVFNGEEKEVALNFNLNLPTYDGFNLNKFLDEGEAACLEEEF